MRACLVQVPLVQPASIRRGAGFADFEVLSGHVSASASSLSASSQRYVSKFSTPRPHLSLRFLKPRPHFQSSSVPATAYLLLGKAGRSARRFGELGPRRHLFQSSAESAAAQLHIRKARRSARKLLISAHAIPVFGGSCHGLSSSRKKRGEALANLVTA